MDAQGTDKKGKDKKKSHSILLTMDIDLYNKLKRESERMHTPVSTLIKFWMAEKVLESELKYGS